MTRGCEGPVEGCTHWILEREKKIIEERLVGRTVRR
jgi:hypothetical protein